MTSPVHIFENVPMTSSTCSVTQIETGSTCTHNDEYLPGVVNQFNDYLIACPTVSSPNPCGFTFANQQRQDCPASGTKSSIGAVGKVTVMNTGVTVDGNSTSLRKGAGFK
jgi:hypothetical protein